MAATVTITAQLGDPPYMYVEGTIAFSGSYSTDGEAITFPNLKNNKNTPTFFHVEGKSGLWYQYDYQNNKLKVYTAAAASGTNPGAVEHTAAAYSSDTNPASGPAGDTVTFWAVFRIIAP